MITPSDTDYKETKAVLSGELKVDESIKKLTNWIEAQFQIKVLHVVKDYLDTLNKPRLNVVLEEYTNVDSFRDKSFNYDSQKQSLISSKFEEINGGIKNSFINSLFKKKTDKYFVCFSAYNPIAKSDIVGQIPSEQLAEFKKRNTKECVWQINDSGTGMIVFVYKDSEIDEFKKSGKIEELKKEFFEMVKPVDKENYFTIDNIAVGVDSKQNFDENYESNWYYYYK